MTKCSYCGVPLKGSENRCPNCGAPIVLVNGEPDSADIPEKIEIPPKVFKKAAPSSQTGGGAHAVPKSAMRLFYAVVIAIMVLTGLMICVWDDAGSQSSHYRQFNSGEVEDMVSDYVNAMVNAVNKGNFDLVKTYLKADAAIYRQQKELVSRLYKKSIKEEFITGTINVEFDSAQNIILAEVFEKHKIMYPSGKSKYVDNYYVYHISPLKPYKICAVKGKNDPYKYGTAGVIVADNTAIRAEASQKADILARAMRNQSVKVFDKKMVDSDTWVRVKHAKSGIAWALASQVSY